MIGRSLLNFNWEGNRDRFIQHEMGIHLSEIGIMHFFAQAGLRGTLWSACGLLKLWKDILTHWVPLCLIAHVVVATITMTAIAFFLRSDSRFHFYVFLGIFASCLPARRPRLDGVM